LLAEYPQLKQRFSQIAFFLSVGEDDRISPPESVREVAEHLRRSGVRRLELSVHRGGHQLDARDLGKALGWLRAQIFQPGVAQHSPAGDGERLSAMDTAASLAPHRSR
jgi:predicted esterase